MSWGYNHSISGITDSRLLNYFFKMNTRGGDEATTRSGCALFPNNSTERHKLFLCTENIEMIEWTWIQHEILAVRKGWQTLCLCQKYSFLQGCSGHIYHNYLDYTESLNHSSTASPTALILDQHRVCLQMAQGTRLCVHAVALWSAPLNASMPLTVMLSLCSAHSRVNAAHVAPAAAACHPTQGQRTFTLCITASHASLPLQPRRQHA